MEVSDHSRHHPWHTCYSFEEDKSHHPLSFGHGVWLIGVVAIASGQVSTPSQDADHVVGHPIGHIADVSVCDFDTLQLLFCDTICDTSMLPLWRSELDVWCILGWREVLEL